VCKACLAALAVTIGGELSQIPRSVSVCVYRPSALSIASDPSCLRTLTRTDRQKTKLEVLNHCYDKVDKRKSEEYATN